MFLYILLYFVIYIWILYILVYFLYLFLKFNLNLFLFKCFILEHKLNDIELLHVLTEEELKELIFIIGERKEFEIALKTLTIAKDTILPLPTLDTTMTLSNTMMTSQNSETISDTEDPPAKKSKSTLSVFSLDQSDIASTSSSILFSESIEVSYSDNENKTDIALSVHNALNFDLKNLLMNHMIGRAILLKFQKTNCIDNTDRNHLSDIIICHFLNQRIRLNNTTISILADKIVEIFTGEKKSTYYVSPIGKKKSCYNRPEIAREKLIDKHRNKLTVLRKTLAITNKQPSKD